MPTNGAGARLQPMRSRNFIISGLALRLLIAFIISWLIVLAFFASGAVSH